MTEIPQSRPELTETTAQALLAAVDLHEVTRFADLGGQALALALGAYTRWDCDVLLVDVGPKGEFCPTPSAWVEGYRAALLDEGIPAQKIHYIAAQKDVHRADVLANLGGYGDAQNIKHLGPLLELFLHETSRMISDIRKGSGSYGLLNRYGACAALDAWEEQGKRVTRVLFRSSHAPDEVEIEDNSTWAIIAARLAGADGFLRDNGMHSFLHVPRGDTLVVTFDNLDVAMTKREDRRPWGYAFIEKQGWSMLGVMANGWTWYRDPWVWEQFDQLAASGFFARYKRVVFYGASMGGYAACAFVAACPGADVVAISPQSTLDKSIVPWETRYKVAWGSDFSGKYGDAAQVSAAAGRVTLLYDPYEALDSGHAERFTGANVVKLRTPLLGHRLGSSLQQMGILGPITLAALNGTLTEGEFYHKLRARRSFGRYQKELFKRVIDRGRPDLARRVGRWVLTRGDNRYIRKAMAAMEG